MASAGTGERIERQQLRQRERRARLARRIRSGTAAIGAPSEPPDAAMIETLV